jgi:TolB-like protein/DNA-binding winged helix-turn-helix (wHTH) protein/Tfp pilus assembly protein PilF
LRQQEAIGPPFRLGEWTVEPAIDEITGRGERFKLEPRTMSVLLLLAQRAPQVVGQAEIERTVWPDVVVTSHSVYQAIAQLRKLLGDDPKAPKYIATVPRKGYRLIAEVRWTSTILAAPLARGPGDTGSFTPAPVRDEPTPRTLSETPAAPRPRRLWIAALVLLGVGVTAVAVWFRGLAQHDGGAPASSVAVLRFEDLSPDRDAGVFAEGIAAELASALSQLPELRVTARTSSFSLVAQQNIQEVGRVLGVRYVVEGSVRRSGDRIRVAAQLIDTRDGYRTWTRSFDRPFANLLPLQDDLARSIAGALQVLIVHSPGVGLSAREPQSLTAYELYLLGQQRYFERTPGALAEAAGYFQRAIDADAQFAAAYASLADTQLAEFYFANRPYEEARALAEPLLQRALALDPDLVSAVAIGGIFKMEGGDVSGADQDLMRAVAINANYPRAHLWLAMIRHEQLRFEEALTSLNRAIELDPLTFILYIWRGLVFDSLGRSTLGEQDFERALMIAPRHPNAHFSYGLNALNRGDVSAAAEHYSRAIAIDPERTDLLQNLALLELDLGAVDAARTHLTRAATIARSGGLHLNHLLWLAVIDSDHARIESLARELESLDPGDAYAAADAALFLGLAGRPADAAALYDGVLERANGHQVMFPVWALRWGMEYHPLLHATFVRAAGNGDRADRMLLDVERYLDGAERNGFRHWGVYYLRAGIAAQRGDAAIALLRLEQAGSLGWRRAWWAQNDPALAPLHGRREFVELLASLAGR